MKDLRITTIQTTLDSTPVDVLSRTGRWYFDASRLNLDHINARAAFEAAPVALGLCDLAGDLLCANQLFINLLELGSLESATGRNLADICPVQGLAEFMERLASTSDVCDMEMPLATNASRPASRQLLCRGQRVVGADLAPRWLALSLLPGPESAGRSQLVMAGFTEAEKRAGMAHWCVLVDHEMTDVRHMEMFWSTGMTAILNGPLPGSRCHDWLGLMAADDQQRMWHCLQALADDGTPFRAEHRLAAGDKAKERVLLSHGWRVAGGYESGHMLVGLTQVHDSCPSRQEELQRIATLCRSMFSDSDWPVCVVDENLKIHYSNYVFQMFLCAQLKAEELTGMSLQQAVHDAAVRRQLIANIRHGLHGQRRAETIKTDMDGISRCFDVNFLPVRSEHAGVLGVMIIARAMPARAENLSP